MPRKGFEAHPHSAIIHRHEHTHVTHYAHPRAVVEHLLSSHRHEHNHSRIEHAHPPHENVPREHLHEAHIHDHAHPAES
ncbi:MAG TPA: hypothetical protein VJP07_04300 [Dehalococcoidia bacterium]|nr:hypothetical protein [Dehalococcoidia bacterium]